MLGYEFKFFTKKRSHQAFQRPPKECPGRGPLVFGHLQEMLFTAIRANGRSRCKKHLQEMLLTAIVQTVGAKAIPIQL